MRPTYLDTDTPPARFVGAYGQLWRSGVISEHLDLFREAGGTHYPSAGLGAGWAVVNGIAYPILCSEIVRIDTEDGPQSGRCGENALDATGTCHAHVPFRCDECGAVADENGVCIWHA